jgi:hypothetical protein
MVRLDTPNHNMLPVLSVTGVTALANAIPGMGALTSLNMSANGLKGAEAGKVLGDAIAANTVLKELDISGGERNLESQQCDVEFVQTFSIGLRDNGALTSLNVSNNNLTKYGRDMSGNRVACVWPPHLITTFVRPFLQVLPPSLMPSAATGQYPL